MSKVFSRLLMLCIVDCVLCIVGFLGLRTVGKMWCNWGKRFRDSY